MYSLSMVVSAVFSIIDPDNIVSFSPLATVTASSKTKAVPDNDVIKTSSSKVSCLTVNFSPLPIAVCNAVFAALIATFALLLTAPFTVNIYLGCKNLGAQKGAYLATLILSSKY